MSTPIPAPLGDRYWALVADAREGELARRVADKLTDAGIRTVYERGLLEDAVTGPRCCGLIVLTTSGWQFSAEGKALHWMVVRHGNRVYYRNPRDLLGENV